MVALKLETNSVISICIPVYNFKVDRLVEALTEQARRLEILYEIILIDDCSEFRFRQHNKQACPDALYVQLEQNIGRAAIRNRFLEYASFDYMLFLDCDSLLADHDFLLSYINSVQKFPEEVHCGGRVYDRQTPVRAQRLRWKYGVIRESRSIRLRSGEPYRSFMTSNFVIPRQTFDTIRFDERLTDYGHEDTLFGLELKQRKVSVVHLDNPVINGHLETNEAYLANTEKGIENLVFLLQNLANSAALIEDVQLLRVCFRLWRLRVFIGWMYSLFGPLVRLLLKRGIVWLWLFDCYKLGVLHQKLGGLNYQKSV